MLVDGWWSVGGVTVGKSLLWHFIYRFWSLLAATNNLRDNYPFLPPLKPVYLHRFSLVFITMSNLTFLSSFYGGSLAVLSFGDRKIENGVSFGFKAVFGLFRYLDVSLGG